MMLVNNNHMVWEENRTEPKRGDADCQSLKEVGNMVSGTE